MKMPSKQKGLSSIGWLFVILTGLFYLTILIKIVPVYLDDASVKGALDGLETEDVANMSDRDIRESVDKHFTINNVRNIDLRDEDEFSISREDGAVSIDVNYETVINIYTDNGFLQTLDVVISFNHHKEFE